MLAGMTPPRATRLRPTTAIELCSLTKPDGAGQAPIYPPYCHSSGQYLPSTFGDAAPPGQAPPLAEPRPPRSGARSGSALRLVPLPARYTTRRTAWPETGTLDAAAGRLLRAGECCSRSSGPYEFPPRPRAQVPRWAARGGPADSRPGARPGGRRGARGGHAALGAAAKGDGTVKAWAIFLAAVAVAASAAAGTLTCYEEPGTRATTCIDQAAVTANGDTR